MLGFLERFVDQTPADALPAGDASSDGSDYESDGGSASSEVRVRYPHMYALIEYRFGSEEICLERAQSLPLPNAP